MNDKEIIAEPKSMNIFEKLSAISVEITNVDKNLTISVGANGKYKAVGEADVLAAVRPLEAKYRVYSYPVDRQIIESGELESVDYKGNVKKQLFERMRIVYRFVNMDNPSEYIEVISYGDGIDSGDKSVGKAMTYGDKYALLKAYKIITGEDPDKDASEPLRSKYTVPTAQPKQAKKELSADVLAELDTLGVTVEQVAGFKNIPADSLTDEIVRPVIIAIKRKRAKQKAQNNISTGQPEQGELKADEDFIGE